jgi:hypothetical protein
MRCHSVGEPNASGNAIGYAKHRSRSHEAVIRVYDEAGNVIQTHEHAGEFKEPWTLALEIGCTATPRACVALARSATSFFTTLKIDNLSKAGWSWGCVSAIRRTYTTKVLYVD